MTHGRPLPSRLRCACRATSPGGGGKGRRHLLRLLRGSPVAEVENREQAGAAVSADDHAQAGDGNLAHLRIGGLDAIADGLGVGPAVGLQDEAEEELTLVETPNAGTIEEVTDFLHKEAFRFVKTLIYNVDGKAVAVMVRGDRDVNETKLRKLLNANEVELADPTMVEDATGAEVGFAGPINIKCSVYADEEVKCMHNFIVGANETGYHYSGVNNEDFKVEAYADLRNIADGDICPQCGKKVHFAHGIEVGNTFKLGTKYSKALNLQYLDQNNQLQYVWMGSYGIGPARAMAALAEQNADDNGINWPKDLAPYQAAIVIISMKKEEQVKAAEDIYEKLTAKGYDVILDNRDVRPGVKFKDMDLVGIPYRITVGRGVSEGKVEVKPRTGEKKDIAIEDVLSETDAFFKD